MSDCDEITCKLSVICLRTGLHNRGREPHTMGERHAQNLEPTGYDCRRRQREPRFLQAKEGALSSIILAPAKQF